MKIGMILGSELENLDFLEEFKEIEIDTPFGKPSSPLIVGKIEDIDVVIILRHGKKHQYTPTNINNRANIFALKYEGCKKIISTTVCNSLKEEIRVGDFVILDQFIDFTKHREVTFFDKFDFKPIHISMNKPFSDDLRNRIITSCRELNQKYHETGTVITVEGNRFSTLAESKLFYSWGVDVVSMSISPEAILANEAEVEYGTIAIPINYDFYTQNEEINYENENNLFNKQINELKKILINTIKSFSKINDRDISPEIAIKRKINIINDFPEQGIISGNTSKLFRDSELMKKIIEKFYERYKDMEIDAIAGIESNGFIIGGILANKLNVGFIPIGKKGTLSGIIERQEYFSERGVNTIEINKDILKKEQKILIINDLLEYGDIINASCKLIEKIGGKIIECGFIAEFSNLKGREKLTNYPIFRIIEIDDN